MRTAEECRIKAAQARGYAADTVNPAYKASFAKMADVWDQTAITAGWRAEAIAEQSIADAIYAIIIKPRVGA